MRHLAWLVSCALVLSCTVNSSNLEFDAAAFGTGGQSAGTGGIKGTGGATGGQVGTGGRIATGGQVGTGGQLGTGGQPGTGGQTATGGQPGTGGQTATGGQPGTGGQGGQNATGGQGGGAGQDGQSGNGGQGGGNQTCAQLQAQYTSALSAARACTPDRPGQCQQRVDTSVACKGCQTYVNDTTELDAIAASWNSAGCDQMHGVCPFACVSPQAAHCAPTANAAASGTCTTTAAP